MRYAGISSATGHVETHCPCKQTLRKQNSCITIKEKVFGLMSHLSNTETNPSENWLTESDCLSQTVKFFWSTIKISTVVVLKKDFKM